MNDKIIDLEKMNVKKEVSSVPLSYLPFRLTAGGKLGVPEVVYCRNFNTSDMITLSMMTDNVIPERIIAVLNSLIYGEVDVSLWPDKCIIELLVFIYVNFFNPIISQIAFPWNDTDITWLEEHKQTEKLEGLKTKKWVPRVDLDLRTLKLKKLGEEIKDRIVIKKKNHEGKSEIIAKFLSYPRYGDSLILKKLTQEKYGELEKKYIGIESLFNTFNRYYEEDRDVSSLPPFDVPLYMEWQEMLLQKNIFLADATLALYLQEWRGQDISALSIEDRIPFIKNPEFDIKMSQQLEKHFDSLDFGIDPEVMVANPITGEPCTRRFQFRLYDILQAIRSFDSNEYDISYD